jgi:hypothetical protein
MVEEQAKEDRRSPRDARKKKNPQRAGEGANLRTTIKGEPEPSNVKELHNGPEEGCNNKPKIT